MHTKKAELNPPLLFSCSDYSSGSAGSLNSPLLLPYWPLPVMMSLSVNVIIVNSGFSNFFFILAFLLCSNILAS